MNTLERTAPQLVIPLPTYAPSVGNPAVAGWKRHPVRVALRLSALVSAMLFSLVEHLVCIRLTGRVGSALANAQWVQRWARRYLRLMGIEVATRGRPPAAGVLATNHLGYLDTLILFASQPLVLVAKDDLRGWPLVGWLARCAGTIFINRTRRADVLRVIRQFPRVVHDGAVVAFFPEATCTDGHVLLPFRSSLFAPAVRHDWPVTPARFDYRIDEGRIEEEVCWWGGMTFLPHFLNLLSKPCIRATLIYGPTRPPGSERKRLARELRAEIAGLSCPAAPPQSRHAHHAASL